MVLRGLLGVPDEWVSPEQKRCFQELLGRLPPRPLGEAGGRRIILPAAGRQHHHAHSTEMYPLYRYQIFGLGLPEFDLIRDTWLHGVPREHRFSYQAWGQGNIHYARTVAIGLSFRGEGSYLGRLIRDGAEAASIKTEQLTFQRGDSVHISMPAGGGFIGRFRKW